MNRRRFFKMALGVLGALALPVPKAWKFTYAMPADNFPVRCVWRRNVFVVNRDVYKRLLEIHEKRDA